MKKKLKFDNSKKAWMVRFLIFLILLYVCDIRLRTVRYTFESPKVDAPVKVALLTDLHGSWYGKEQGELIKAIDKEAPDAVLLGGDILQGYPRLLYAYTFRFCTRKKRQKVLQYGMLFA